MPMEPSQPRFGGASFLARLARDFYSVWGRRFLPHTDSYLIDCGSVGKFCPRWIKSYRFVGWRGSAPKWHRKPTTRKSLPRSNELAARSNQACAGSNRPLRTETAQARRDALGLLRCWRLGYHDLLKRPVERSVWHPNSGHRDMQQVRCTLARCRSGCSRSTPADFADTDLLRPSNIR